MEKSGKIEPIFERASLKFYLTSMYIMVQLNTKFNVILCIRYVVIYSDESKNSMVAQPGDLCQHNLQYCHLFL